MTTSINESVSVGLLSDHIHKAILPRFLSWRGKRYTITRLGLHHTTRVGRTLYHIFSVTDDTMFFKLQFDTETLGWRLLEIAEAV